MAIEHGVDWNTALYALDNHRSAFAYFYLKNKGVDLSEQDKEKYEQVQERIRNRMNEVNEFYNRGTKEEERVIKNYLINKRDESMEIEEAIFNSIVDTLGLE